MMTILNGEIVYNVEGFSTVRRPNLRKEVRTVFE